MPVWVLWAYSVQHGMTPKQIAKLWLGELTEEDVRAALLYAEAHPDLIEDKTKAQLPVPPPEVYFDDCVARQLAQLLRATGLVVHRPAEVGTVGVSDSGHLMTCMRGNWVLVPQNRGDFRRLHWLWTALYDWGVLPEEHPGILTIHEQTAAAHQAWAAAIVDLLQQRPSLRGQMYRWRPAAARWDAEPPQLM